MSLRIPASLRRSLEAMDNAELRVASAPSAWLVVIGFTAFVLVLNGYPPTGSWLQLDAWRIGGALFISVLLAAHFWWVQHRDGVRFSLHQGAALLIGTSGTQFFAACLYFGAKPPASQIFGMLFVFSCLVNGGQTRAGARRPWMAVGTTLALLCALLWMGGEARWGELLVMLVCAIIVELTAGEMAYSKQRAAAEGARLRAVVHSQLLQHQEQDAARLTDALEDAAQNSRAIRKAAAEAATLCDLLQGLPFNAGGRHGVSVSRLRELISDMESLALKAADAQGATHANREPVPLAPLMGLVIDSIRFRYPRLVVELRGGLNDTLEGLLIGGAVGFRRIFENLLVNACEGDGQRGAERISVMTSVSPYTGQVTLEIRDDGPGFPPEVLAAPVEGLVTTKEGRQNGLSLYSAAALLQASGGRLERANTDPQGAVVRISLPVHQQPEVLRASA